MVFTIGSSSKVSYLCDSFFAPFCLVAASSDRLDLIVPNVRAPLVQSRSFSCIGLCLSVCLCLSLSVSFFLPMKRFLPSVRSTALSGSLSPSYSYLILCSIFSLDPPRWKHFYMAYMYAERSTLQMVKDNKMHHNIKSNAVIIYSSSTSNNNSNNDNNT